MARGEAGRVPRAMGLEAGARRATSPTMFDFRPDAGTPKPEAYRQLLDAAEALTASERDAVANMANVAALLWDFLPQLNWAGFYRMVDGELVLGPFMGRPA